MSENKNSKTKIVPCSVQPSCKDIVDLLNLLLFLSVVKVFSYVQQLLHLLYSYSYFSHMFCDHLYVHGKKVCKTWTVHVELVTTDLNFRSRS